jgi:crotonobetainyl-CoA:carnitine CoA-transferase CaiB-like acyl-CoA transferase
VLLVRIIIFRNSSIVLLSLGPSVNFENIEKSSMLRHSAPILGEHTRSILQTELHYTPEEINKLLQDKIIQ